MKRIALLLTLTTLLAAPAVAQTVETGHANWAKLPPLKRKDSRVAPPIDWTSRILASGECKMPGQRPDKFDIDVPYAALVEPDGTVRRIVIQEIGCPPLETMVGTALVAMVKRGEVKPTGRNRASWFADRVNFSLE